MVKVLTELISNIPSSFTSKVLPKPLNPGPMISDLFPLEDKILVTITVYRYKWTPTVGTNLNGWGTWEVANA